jgi:transposase
VYNQPKNNEGERNTCTKHSRFRLYPTKKQTISIHKSIGSSRFVFHHFLARWNDTYRETGKGLTYSICAKLLTSLKQQLEWLKEADAHALQSSLRNLDDAFQRFFQKQNDAPRFKSKRTYSSLTPPRSKRKINYQKGVSREIRLNSRSWAG